MWPPGPVSASHRVGRQSERTSSSNTSTGSSSGSSTDHRKTAGPVTAGVSTRSPAIDMSGAAAGTLSFQQWTEIEQVPGDLDYGSIRILDANDDSVLAVTENRTIDGSTSGWEEYSMALPPEAFTAAAGTIKVEWQFEADDIDSFAGNHIDVVTVTAFDADGNPVTVALSNNSDDTIAGNTVTAGPDLDDPVPPRGQSRRLEVEDQELSFVDLPVTHRHR